MTKYFIVFNIIFILSSCNSGKKDNSVTTEHTAKKEEIVYHDSTKTKNPNTTITEHIPSLNTQTDTFEVDDYYRFFFDIPLEDFKNLDYKKAYQLKTFVLNDLDYHNGYMSFGTQNTPPDWDGDSKTEFSYEITYWNKEKNKRIIALNKTEVTWVSEKSEVTFYLHDSTGINEYNPLERRWKLDDFTEENINSFFPASFVNDPPVIISLPNKGLEIKIDLGVHEHYEPQEIFYLFDSLQPQIHSIKTNPVTGKIERF